VTNLPIKLAEQPLVGWRQNDEMAAGLEQCARGFYLGPIVLYML
jgi:hypothetical protein